MDPYMWDYLILQIRHGRSLFRPCPAGSGRTRPPRCHRDVRYHVVILGSRRRLRGGWVQSGPIPTRPRRLHPSGAGRTPTGAGPDTGSTTSAQDPSVHLLRCSGHLKDTASGSMRRLARFLLWDTTPTPSSPRSSRRFVRRGSGRISVRCRPCHDGHDLERQEQRSPSATGAARSRLRRLQRPGVPSHSRSSGREPAECPSRAATPLSTSPYICSHPAPADFMDFKVPLAMTMRCSPGG